MKSTEAFTPDEIVMLGQVEPPRLKRGRAPGFTKYPFGELNVYDAFEIARAIGTVRDAARRYMEVQEPEKKFVVRHSKRPGWSTCIRVK